LGTEIDKIPQLLKEHLYSVFKGHEIHLSETTSCQYLEKITVSDKSSHATLGFHYNGKCQVTSIVFLNGTKELYDKVKSLVSENGEPVAQTVITSPLSSFYAELQRIVANSKIIVKKSEGYQDIIEFIVDSAKVSVQVWHTKELMISHFNFMDGSQELFDRITGRIKEYFGIE
jgi:hypothetical protein